LLFDAGLEAGSLCNDQDVERRKRASGKSAPLPNNPSVDLLWLFPITLE